MSLSIQERIDFISGLDIKVEAAGAGNNSQFAAAAAEQDDETALVSGGSGISFLAGIYGQMKDDVANSTLFAQLAANRAYNRQDDWENWYKFYNNTLEKLGWIVQGAGMTKLDFASGFGSVDNLLLSLAKEYLTGGEVALFTDTLTALSDARNNSSRAIFDRSSMNANKANFQVGVVSASGGDPVFKVGTYVFSAAQNIDTVLFFKFAGQKVTFYGGSQRMVLNTKIYKGVRQTVIQKLGAAIKNDILNIDL